MILDFEFKNSTLIVSEIDERGNIKLNRYDWANPKQYVKCSENDPHRNKTYTTWDGSAVKLEYTKRPNRFAVYEFIDRLPVAEKERLFALNIPKTFFMDIETEILPDGFVEPLVANSRVLTIAVVHKQKVLVLGTKELPMIEQLKIKQKIEKHFSKYNLTIEFKYKSFHEEKEPEHAMLSYLFYDLVPKMPVITGWNFLDYDWTFLVNRCRLVGVNPNASSFTNKLEKVFNMDYELPTHRLIVDYMQIYKKWDTSVKVKETNSLDWVGEKITGCRKVPHELGLQEMYEQDFTEYVFYNAVDTVLVQLIHEKTRLMDIMFAISSAAKIRLCDFGYKSLQTTLVQSEGFLREEFRNNRKIVFVKDAEQSAVEGTIEGGHVRTPYRGMNEWVVTYDFSSLYPMIMRQFKIAPENFKGVLMPGNDGLAIYNGKIKKVEPTDVVCTTGSVFTNGQSVTVDFLTNVFNERKRYKNLMNVNIKDIKVTEDYLADLLKQREALEA